MTLTDHLDELIELVKRNDAAKEQHGLEVLALADDVAGIEPGEFDSPEVLAVKDAFAKLIDLVIRSQAGDRRFYDRMLQSLKAQRQAWQVPD